MESKEAQCFCPNSVPYATLHNFLHIDTPIQMLPGAENSSSRAESDIWEEFGLVQDEEITIVKLVTPSD